MSMMTNLLKETNVTKSNKQGLPKVSCLTGGLVTPQYHPLDNYGMNETEFVENLMAGKSRTPL